MFRLLSAVLIFFAAGCCACKKSSAVLSGPASPLVTVTTAGGFSGRASGYIINDDGMVLYHTKMADRKTLDTLGSIGSRVVDELRGIIVSHKLADYRHQENGNMTTSFVIVTGSMMNVISWPGVFPDMENAPEQVRSLFVRLAEVLDPYMRKMGEK